MAGSLQRLEMRAATRADAPRIAEIHMAAFGSNAMLRAQFPTPTVRKGLQKTIELKALADIDDPKTTVLVVTSSTEQEGSDDTVIAFAKWSHPVLPGEDYVEPPWAWPEGTDLATLEAWTIKTEEAQQVCLGDSPCYNGAFQCRTLGSRHSANDTRLMRHLKTHSIIGLTFIGTDPTYIGLGAGSLLVQWGIAQCNGNRSPIYLESTVEAVPFYRKHGFISRETISLPVRPDGSSETEIYEEIAFTYPQI